MAYGAYLTLDSAYSVLREIQLLHSFPHWLYCILYVTIVVFDGVDYKGIKGRGIGPQNMERLDINTDGCSKFLVVLYICTCGNVVQCYDCHLSLTVPVILN